MIEIVQIIQKSTELVALKDNSCINNFCGTLYRKVDFFLTEIGSVTVNFSARRAEIIQKLHANCHQFNEINFFVITTSLHITIEIFENFVGSCGRTI